MRCENGYISAFTPYEENKTFKIEYMHRVVKITKDNWGSKRLNPKWHLVVTDAATDRTLCDGEAFGVGDSRAEYEEKTCKKGGITCDDCLDEIRWFKSIKL